MKDQRVTLSESGSVKCFPVSGLLKATILAAALFLPVQALAESAPLPVFANELMAAVGAEGKLDLTRFVCTAEPSIIADQTANDCRDPVSGLKFQHYGEAAGDMLAISVEVPGRDPEIAAMAGILVPDRASFDALRASFLALPDMPAFAGLTRCQMFPTGQEDDPAQVAGFAVNHPVSNQPVAFVFAGIDNAAARLLEVPQAETQVLMAILVLISPGYDCIPAE